MEFKNLLSDNSCDCTINSKEDTTSLFAKKTNKNKLRLQDFNSYWDKGRRTESESCDEICSLKGVSISLLTTDTESEVVEIFKSLFQLAPKYKPYFCVIKFYESSGMVKYTPMDNNKYHYDFYKSDDFDFEKVNLITVNELH